MKNTTLVRAACFSTLLFASSSYAQYLHLDADSIGAVDGAAVTSWAPTVGLDTFTGSATYVADWNNSGHASLLFNGAGDYMSTLLTGGPDVGDMTMIVAGAWNSSVLPYYDYMTAATSGTRARIFEDRGNIGARMGDSGTATHSGALGYGNPFVMAVRSSSSYLDFWISDTEGNYDFAWAGSSTASSSATLPGLVLAANGGLSEFSDVNIAEVMIFDTSSMGSGDIRPIVDGLVAKYTAVPEPSTFALFLGGLSMLVVGRLRRA